MHRPAHRLALGFSLAVSLPLPTVLSVVLSVPGCADQGAPAPPAGPGTPTPSTVPFAPAPAVLRRLTQGQYINTVHDVLGSDILVTGAMEPDVAESGFFSVGASDTSVSARGVEQYEALAYDIARQALTSPTHRGALVPCAPSSPGDTACAQTAIAAMGRRLWRRPLTSDELTALTTVATGAGVAVNDFYGGLQYALAAILQSPDFLFRAELAVPDPAQPQHGLYDTTSLASRLSYFLWNGPPDDELLTVAGTGGLDTPAGVSTEVTRMLASPLAHRGLRAFVTEWLRLDQLDDLQKDATVFTEVSPDVGPSAREETLRDFEHTAFDLDGDYRDLLTTRDTYVNPKLAELYSVRAPAGRDFGLVTLPDNLPRRGLLGQVSVLALQAHPTTSSPTLRGRFIRQSLLCNVIPPPPVNVNTALPPPTTGLATLRQRLTVHATVPFCASCHGLMDPLGLSLESFDGIGRYRTLDNGAPIDTHGQLDTVSFTDASQLAQVLHDDPGLGPCFASRVYRYAVGHVETDGESSEVDRVSGVFATQGYRIRGLMAAIATSDAFRRAAVTTVTPGSP